MKRFLKNQIGYLLSGLIAWLPIVILGILGNWAFRGIDSAGQSIISIFPMDRTLPVGAGFGIIVLIFYISGVMIKKTCVKNFAAKIPILGFFVGQKDGKFMTLERLSNLTPCLFLYSPTCPSYGFILSEENIVLNESEAPFTLFNIYYPNVPTLVMGQVYIVRKETVVKLGNPAKEIVSLLLYTSRSPKNIKYLPWEGETEEKFKERACNFGIKV